MLASDMTRSRDREALRQASALRTHSPLFLRGNLGSFAPRLSSLRKPGVLSQVLQLAILLICFNADVSGVGIARILADTTASIFIVVLLHLGGELHLSRRSISCCSPHLGRETKTGAGVYALYLLSGTPTMLMKWFVKEVCNRAKRDLLGMCIPCLRTHRSLLEQDAPGMPNGVRRAPFGYEVEADDCSSLPSSLTGLPRRNPKRCDVTCEEVRK
jgi:hypothetical protein